MEGKVPLAHPGPDLVLVLVVLTTAAAPVKDAGICVCISENSHVLDNLSQSGA